MANIDSTTLTANKFMQAFGNAVNYSGTIALTANPTADDVIRIMVIPAGTKVTGVLIGNGDLDSNVSPTLVVSMGYAPVDGSSPAASAAYFQAAGDTVLQAANAGKVYRNFADVTFEKDVYLTMTVGTASATWANGSIRATVFGEARGVK